MDPKELRSVFIAWFEANYPLSPNSQSIATAVAWGEHLLQYAAAKADPEQP